MAIRTPNIENIRTWVRALEDGEYLQTRHTLAGPSIDPKHPAKRGYCCLGVACDVAAVAVGGKWSGATAPDFVIPDDGERGHEVASTHLPDAVSEWLGVGGDNVRIRLRSGRPRILASEANDDGATFAEIAAALRDEFDLGTREDEDD